VNIAHQMKQPRKRNGSLLSVRIGCSDLPVAGQRRQYVWNPGRLTRMWAGWPVGLNGMLT
jgi:hypothetical protein